MMGTLELVALGGEHFTDMGNAKRLAFLHGDRIRWCPSIGWLVFDGTRWRGSDDSEILGFAKDVPELLLRQAADETANPERRKALANWALASERAGALSAMGKLLKSEVGIRVEESALDSDAELLNLRNGTLDLRTGELLRHSPGDLMTKVAGASFDSAATCPGWERFLLEVMGGDVELVGYLQRFAGYMLTGTTREQCFLFISGLGANGKGVFVETLAALLGEYAAPLSPGALVVKYGDQPTNELAALRGCRYVFCSEVEPGKTLDSALLKAMSGEDSLRVRFLFREHFTLRPQFKLVYSANGAPRVRDTSYGFWRRCKHIPFNVTFPPERRDPELRSKLLQELDGILNWALSGLREWRRDGLKEPRIVSTATRQYQDDQSVVLSFLDDTTRRIPGHDVPLSRLHEAFVEWAKRNGERVISNKALRKELEAAGFTARKGMCGVMVEGLAFTAVE